MQDQNLFNRIQEYQSFASGQTIFREGEPGNNLYIVAVSIGAGLIPLVAPRWAQQMPHDLQILLESGILLTSLTAVALNAYFNGGSGDMVACVEAAKAAGAE